MTATAPIDWRAPAMLLERDDDGSERYYEFRTIGTGSVHELVSRVVATSPQDRARMLIDGGAQGTWTVSDILALSARADFATP